MFNPSTGKWEIEISHCLYWKSFLSEIVREDIAIIRNYLREKEDFTKFEKNSKFDFQP